MLGEEGVGCIAFSPLAQGMLTDRYLDGIPEDSRAATGSVPQRRTCSPRSGSAHVRALNEIAGRRGQTLAQMALAWVLRDPRVTSALDRRARASSSSTTRLGALDRPRLLRRRAARDRPARRRRRHQHLGGVQPRVMRGWCRAPEGAAP